MCTALEKNLTPGIFLKNAMRGDFPLKKVSGDMFEKFPPLREISPPSNQPQILIRGGNFSAAEGGRKILGIYQ